MADIPPRKAAARARDFGQSVGAQERRKLRANRMRSPVWPGLGMLGIVGWSIGIPTLLGTFVGLWLDKRHPGGREWTVALMFAGLCLGCASAWHWITREQRAIHRDGERES